MCRRRGAGILFNLISGQLHHNVTDTPCPVADICIKVMAGLRYVTLIIWNRFFDMAYISGITRKSDL
jgi:hypothetical protein